MDASRPQHERAVSLSGRRVLYRHALVRETFVPRERLTNGIQESASREVRRIGYWSSYAPALVLGHAMNQIGTDPWLEGEIIR